MGWGEGVVYSTLPVCVCVLGGRSTLACVVLCGCIQLCVAYRGRLCEPVCMCSVHWLGESCISCYSMGCVYVWGEGVHSTLAISMGKLCCVQYIGLCVCVWVCVL